MSGRVRRTTTKAINYAKEQEFSDDDVFEDDAGKPVSAPPSATKPVRKRGRPKKVDMAVPEDLDETDFTAPKPVYTEKGYDPNLPPIRERFPFLPEFEADGSPRIELIVGRRPLDRKGGNKSSAGKAEDGDEARKTEDDDDDDDDAQDGPSSSKKRGGRRGKRKTKQQIQQEKKEQAAAAASDDTTEYEYLIKYKGKSYLHLDWKNGGDLESMNKSAKTLYRRYLKKIAAGVEEDLEDPDFDPTYIQPQRILDEDEHEVNVELTDKELIEWEKEREKELEEEEESEEDDDDSEAEKAKSKDTGGVPGAAKDGDTDKDKKKGE